LKRFEEVLKSFQMFIEAWKGFDIFGEVLRISEDLNE